MNRLGEILKSARLKKGLTLEGVGSDYGIASGYLSQIENGKRLVPSIRILHKLSKAYWLPFNMLCTAARQGLKDYEGEMDYVEDYKSNGIGWSVNE